MINRRSFGPRGSSERASRSPNTSRTSRLDQQGLPPGSASGALGDTALAVDVNSQRHADDRDDELSGLLEAGRCRWSRCGSRSRGRGRSEGGGDRTDDDRPPYRHHLRRTEGFPRRRPPSTSGQDRGADVGRLAGSLRWRCPSPGDPGSGPVVADDPDACFGVKGTVPASAVGLVGRQVTVRPRRRRSAHPEWGLAAYPAIHPMRRNARRPRLANRWSAVGAPGRIRTCATASGGLHST